MKIAILTFAGVGRDGIRGVVPCFLSLVERLVQEGDDVHVFAKRQELEPAHWLLLGAQIHNAGHSNWRMIAQIVAEHRRKRFDVMHALWIRPAGVVAAVLGRLLGIPILLHLIGDDLACLPNLQYGVRTTLKGRMLMRLAVAGAKRIAVESEIGVERAHALNISADRAPFGVATDRWPVAAPRPRAPGARAKLLHVAVLAPIKNQDMLLETMAHLRAMNIDFELTCIGLDTLNGSVQRRAQELGLSDHVHFLGPRPHHALRENFEEADLFVITSYDEGAPVVALEAAIAGVPTVGTDVGRIAEFARVGAACVAPMGDSRGLAEIIADLLTHDDKRLALAARVQRKAVNEDADATTHHIRNLYLKLMGTSY